MVMPIVIGAFGIRNGRLGNESMSGDHPNYSIVEISKNTEKRPEDLRRLAVTQTPVKSHQLTLEFLKNSQKRKIISIIIDCF